MGKRDRKRKRTGRIDTRRIPPAAPEARGIPEPDDYFELGPMSVARYGRFVHYQTDGSPEELRAFHDALGECRFDCKDRIDASINRLLEVLERHDPIELIASVTLSTIVSASQVDSAKAEEDASAPEDEYNAASIEYLQGLATARAFPDACSAVTQNVVEDTRSILANLRRDLRWYYAFEQRTKGEKHGIGLARYRMIGHTLFIRGDGYPAHVREILLRVHSCADSFLRESYGFAVEDLVEFAATILRQLEDRVNESLDTLADRLNETYAAYEAFVAWCEGEGIAESQATPEDIRRFAVDHPPEMYLDEDRWQEQAEKAHPRSLVQVIPTTPAQQRLAELLSLQFGENAVFLDAEYGKGWPLNRSLVRERPLIQHQGEYFAPDPRVVALSLRTALDALIRNKDSAYFRGAYADARHDAAVDVAAEHLARVFGRDAVVKHAFYSKAGGSSAGSPEIDLLVIFGGAVIAVEVKAGGLRPSVRRGAELSMRDELGQMLEDGQAQVEGLHNLLAEADVVLRNGRGEEILTLRTGDTRLWFSMVVTLEDVTAVSTQLPMLSDLGFAWEGPKAHVVSLPDLLVLADVLDTPSDFLHYLHRRKSILDEWGVFSADELDYLMFYLSEDLWMEDMDVGEHRVMHIGIYTQELDQYYEALERGDGAAKPRAQVPDGLRRLIRGLECHPAGDALHAILFMLDCSSEARQQIADNVVRAESQTLRDGGVHSITLTFDKHVLFVGAHSKPGNADVAHGMAAKWFGRGFDEATVVLWVPFAGYGSAKAWHILDDCRQAG
ncbi:MAG: hypothetical protein JXA87_12435 [Thermoleophilia bacterium]|nr:hypothetical protein [Thermoleophilia bacterium]